MISRFQSGNTPRRLLTSAAAVLCASSLVSAADEGKKVDRAAAKEAAEHMKEELGVNEFTTPSIATVLAALKELKPLTLDKAARELPDSVPGDRARLALSTGALIADGFLSVSAEKQSRLDDIGRLLIKHAKGLGVSEHVTRHSKSILEKGAAKDWPGIRAELVATQRDVEKAMMALKDEEIAHLVALGGWTRGLEITSGLIAEQYTPDRAAILVQASVLGYFIDRVETLNPALKKGKVFTLIGTNLVEIRKLSIKDGGAPPTADDLRKINQLTAAIITLVGTPEE
jgi:hypothetical protein